jgi:hypothetical protein
MTVIATIVFMFAAGVQATQAGKVDEVPKAKGHDAAIEKLIGSNYMRVYPEWKVLKVLLTASRTSWEIQRAPNGNIVSRSVYATVVARKADKCELYSTYWEQQHDGKSFSGNVEEHGQGATEQDEIDCDKIK